MLREKKWKLIVLSPHCLLYFCQVVLYEGSLKVDLYHPYCFRKQYVTNCDTAKYQGCDYETKGPLKKKESKYISLIFACFSAATWFCTSFS